MAESGKQWRGCSTLPELFQASANDWGNNSYLGIRHRRRDGSLDTWFEWETYREVELSVTAIARSLRVVLRETACPGLTAAILGPVSAEAVKIWQACCHLSAIPVFAQCDGSISTKQLSALLTAFNFDVIFVHQEHQQLAADAIAAAISATEASQTAAPGTAAVGVPTLVVVWGAGGIRYTQPDADIAERMQASGVATVVGYESFKRSHFNNEPSAAFADMIMPKAADVAAVLVRKPTVMATHATAADDEAAAASSSKAAAGAAAAAAALADVGLTVDGLTHEQLVGAAVGMLRQRFPKLEGTMQPYVSSDTTGKEWTGRPHITTSCITGADLADVQKLVRLTAATAAAGRVACDDVTEGATADGVQLLVDL